MIGKVLLVRHAESRANAGLAATASPANIPLSEFGQLQAKAFSLQIPIAPLRIVCSPFLRARQTAEPTSIRFKVPIDIWPIQEFTYLSPDRCVNTNVADRRYWVKQYWERADPSFVDGPGAESFSDFFSRVKAAVSKLDTLLRHAKYSVLFGHGQFITALRLVAASERSIDEHALIIQMRESLRNPMANCSTCTLALMDDGRLAVGGG
jgi:probable phosphoglycerate mutase